MADPALFADLESPLDEEPLFHIDPKDRLGICEDDRQAAFKALVRRSPGYNIAAVLNDHEWGLKGLNRARKLGAWRGTVMPSHTKPSPYAARAAERFNEAHRGPQHEREPDMARTARKPPEDGGVIPTKDFAGAVRLYRNDIKPALSKVGEHNQEAGNAYKAIKKGCNIQPQAAKLAFKLDTMEEAKRDDFMRCFAGLCKELNIPMAPADLVDLAEGKIDAAVPRGKPKLVTIPVSDGVDADLVDAANEPAPGTSAAAVKAMREDHAKDKAEEDFDGQPPRREPVES